MKEKTFYCLGDIYTFLQHARADWGFQAIQRANIHRAAQQFFQAQLQSDQTKQPHRPVKLDQQVHITVHASLSPRNRAKQGQSFHPKRPDFNSILSKNLQYKVAFHAFIIQYHAIVIMMEVLLRGSDI